MALVVSADVVVPGVVVLPGVIVPVVVVVLGGVVVPAVCVDEVVEDTVVVVDGEISHCEPVKSPEQMQTHCEPREMNDASLKQDPGEQAFGRPHWLPV
jgi:hypothetical protein